jgi:hypothetical protein
MLLAAGILAIEVFSKEGNELSAVMTGDLGRALLLCGDKNLSKKDNLREVIELLVLKTETGARWMDASCVVDARADDRRRNADTRAKIPDLKAITCYQINKLCHSCSSLQ